MIEDKATERWKERAKKLGLIVNTGVDKSKLKPSTMPKPKETSKVSKNGSKK
jgi:hypothetical protein